MHVHKPRAAHSLREFLSEIGIIVVGVLIAVALEQGVERLNWAEHVRAAEAQMRKELSIDDGPQAYQRISKSPCIAAQLDGLEHDLLAERDTGAAFRARPITTPSFYTWDSDAYRLAISSGAMAHVSVERAYAWSSPYTLLPDMDSLSLREAGDYAALAGVSDAPPHPTEAMRERLLAAVMAARGDNALLTYLAHMFVRYAREPGVRMTPSQKRRALDSDLKFPGCRTVRED